MGIVRLDVPFYIQLFGPFKVISATNNDFTPRGRKACAVLALLAMAPNYERSRKWLQDKLWSDRGEEQGAASLRQCLAEIKRVVGSENPILLTDRSIIQLDTTKISIQSIGKNQDSIFLDGLDIFDNEFEVWLREQRASLDAEQGQLQENNVTSTLEFESTNPPKLFIELGSFADNTVDTVIAQSVSDAVGKLVSDIYVAKIFNGNSKLSSDAKSSMDSGDTGIVLKASSVGDGSLLRVMLEEMNTSRLVWSDTIETSKANSSKYLNSKILRAVNVAAHSAVEWFCGPEKNNSPLHIEYVRGMSLIHQHTFEHYLQADKCFENCYKMAPKGVYLAWQAYIRSFMVAEMMPHQEQQLKEEAQYLVAKAIERAPNNSLVLSLCSHVKSTVFLSFIPAYELARRSVELNPANAFGWVSLGFSESHLGRLENGMKHCRKAREIAGTSPFKFHIDILSCIVAVLTGNLEEAKHFGMAGHDSAPNLAAPLRFLTALYFHDKNENLAYSIIGKLKVLEPGFSIEHLRDADYPSESLRKSRLIKSVPFREV